MATYRQLAYMIADFSKSIADDTIINIDHIIFLMSRYRTHLKQYFCKRQKGFV